MIFETAYEVDDWELQITDGLQPKYQNVLGTYENVGRFLMITFLFWTTCVSSKSHNANQQRGERARAFWHKQARSAWITDLSKFRVFCLFFVSSNNSNENFGNELYYDGFSVGQKRKIYYLDTQLKF